MDFETLQGNLMLHRNFESKNLSKYQFKAGIGKSPRHLTGLTTEVVLRPSTVVKERVKGGLSLCVEHIAQVFRVSVSILNTLPKFSQSWSCVLRLLVKNSILRQTMCKTDKNSQKIMKKEAEGRDVGSLALVLKSMSKFSQSQSSC